MDLYLRNIRKNYHSNLNDLVNIRPTNGIFTVNSKRCHAMAYSDTDIDRKLILILIFKNILINF